MLNSILTNVNTASIVSVNEFLMCTAGSLILGGILAWIHTYKNQYSKNFIMTLVMLPVMVQAVIMLVNGNLGTGVAVMGAFSLVRFRSMPGNSREITSVFLAMAIGLACGMGYVGMAATLTAVIGVFTILLSRMPIGEGKFAEKDLRITIPENLDYYDVFDDIFQEFASKSELLRVKTVNMGSLYELQYRIILKDEKTQKEMIDALRVRNGNLTIVCGRVSTLKEEL